MKGADLNAHMRTLRLSGAALARLVGKNESTISSYRRPAAIVPKWLEIVMLLLVNASDIQGMVDTARKGRR